MEYKNIFSVKQTEEKILLLLRDIDEFPSERKISENLGVSRSVIRAAIHHLESENELVRIDGKLKTNKAISISMLGSGSMSQELQMDNKNSEVIQFSKDIVNTSNKKIRDFFEVNKNPKLIKLSRMRRNEGIPISYEITYMNYNRFPKLLEVELENGSLYKTLEKYYSIKVAYGREEISCVKADKKKANILGISIGSPLFKVSSYNYDADDNPVEHTDQFLSGSKFQYILHATNIFDYKEDLD
ncbi:GntR family transcriptional regulator [Lactobacillus johnsonii]|jgi:DNA-binding GntR family transcriptional regulator|uniref:GntR family transcriptional regulator n=1 Tax=Lactobacillus johnsonii TaxID=33959 RepID=UPI001C11A229|nr:GntR family transcriptional regulator [Lactobacillus johnsonii]MBU5319607.1 GntR family transcriptional regulator [Lactobacillus johnsonii]